MANVLETEAAADGAGGPQISQIRRPLFIAGAFIAAVFMLTLWSLSSKKDKPAREAEPAESAESPIYVPDRESARKLGEETTKVADEEARAAQAVTELAELQGSPMAEVGQAATVASRADRHKDKQRELIEEYELKALDVDLQMRLEALASDTRIKAVERARRNTLQEASSLMQAADPGLDGVTGAGGGEESMAALLGPAMAALRDRGGGGVNTDGLGRALKSLTQGEERDPNKHAEKLDFFKGGGAHLEPGELEHEMTRPRTPYELQMGSNIPCILISKIVSAVPGMITGQVSQNVYDSATGKHLLIPQGTRAVGMYNAEVTQGQARLQIVWIRLNFPDGQKLNLGSMPGSDHAGVAGLEDQVDRHLWKRLGAALLSSSITVAYEITAPRGAMESAVHRGVGEDIVRLGTEMAREASEQPPVITVRQGAPFLINVNKDIAFKRPYDDGIRRDPRPVRAP